MEKQKVSLENVSFGNFKELIRILRIHGFTKNKVREIVTNNQSYLSSPGVMGGIMVGRISIYDFAVPDTYHDI